MDRNYFLEFEFELRNDSTYLKDLDLTKFLEKIKRNFCLEFNVYYYFNVYVVPIVGDKSIHSNDWVNTYSIILYFNHDIDMDKSLELLYYEVIDRFSVEDNYILDEEGVLYHNHLCLSLNMLTD